jgi:uncharacterized phage protein (TIGR01671 family)
MSREIKFRVWDALRKDMHHYDLSKISNGSYNINPDHIMQFTGLHDRTGKEIYEGDIVSYYELNPYVILYQDGLYLLENKELGNVYFPLWGECEVIGNIFENPDLL